MAKLYNLARMTTATTGTGTITLGSAVSGYLTFALAGVANADIVSYGIKDGANSEIGTGTYTSAGTTLTRNVTKSTNANAAISLSGSAEVFITPRAEDLQAAPTIQRFTSGTAATYTTPANALWIRIRMVGGGGGGSGGGTSYGNGGNGTASTWSGGTLSAGGGTGGTGLAIGGAGGASSGGSVTNISGGIGGGASVNTGTVAGMGGGSYFGGAGGGAGVAASGGAAAVNSGSGGGGAGASASQVGSGGGAGGYVEHIITSPAATYTYTVGPGGNGGTAGTSGGAGGAGAAGQIIVEENYN